MLTALDSSVILDVLTNDAEHAARSEAAIRRSAEAGGLVISEYALAELMAAWPDEPAGRASAFLEEWQIEFVPSGIECVLKAGELLRRRLERDGKSAAGLIPDLLVGSHALLHADRLLVRRREPWKPTIEELEVVQP